MTGNWKLNGTDLQGDVTIFATAQSVRQQVRQSKTALHGGSEDRQKTGTDLPTLNITISVFAKNHAALYSELDDVTDVLDSDEVWTLEAPQDPSLYVYKNHRRAALSTDSWTYTHRGAHRVDLQVQATINGVWIADGGSYCETVTGNFELDSTGPDVYIRDDGTDTGTSPLLRLPEQTSGYPIAVEDDFTESTPPTSGSPVADTVDGLTVYYQDYDLTGYLIPEPTVAGDVGLYQVCSSPTDAFLGGGEVLLEALGVGSGNIGAFMVGSA